MIFPSFHNDGKSPILCHGLQCIEIEVKQDLFQAVRVYLNLRDCRIYVAGY